MKPTKSYIFALIAIILATACTSSATDSLLEEEILEPLAAELVFPENNTECNEGNIISDTQSAVVFRWNTSENTDSYEVVLIKTATGQMESFDVSTNSDEITLERGINYQWYVVSKSLQTDVIATSETFQFFNSGPGVVNHVPFSAEVLAPGNGVEINPISQKINLQWKATDINNDILNYEVFFGTDKEQLASLGVVSEALLEVDISSGNTYFWMIKTNDEANNTSASEIFQFTVN